MIKSIHDTEDEDKDDLSWTLSRKAFIRSLLIAGIASQLPILSACSEIELSDEGVFKNIDPLNQVQYKTIREVQNVLFPSQGPGPGALEVNADKYLIWVLNDSLLDPKKKYFIINNINKLNTTAKNKLGNSFINLSKKEKEEFIAFIAKENWGKKWLSRLLTLIFEALLLDPLYGGNPKNIAWSWLGHHPGQPRPSKEISYPSIISTIDEI